MGSVTAPPAFVHRASRLGRLLRLVLLVVGTCLLGPGVPEAEAAASAPKEAPARRTIGVQSAAPAGGTAFYANSWAVVVGVNQFKEVKISQLNYAVNDATSIAQALEGVGFPRANILTLLDQQATRGEVERVLSSVLRRRAGPEDRIFIFFATHGVTLPLPGGGEEGYLLPYDAELDDLPLTAFSMSQIKLISQRLPAKHTLVAVDACYGGYSLVRAQAPTVFDQRYLDLLAKTRGVQVLTAGKKDQPVIEEQGHGVFTRKLLDGLAGHADTNRDGLITLGELAAWLHPRVAQASDYKQDLQWGNLDGEGQFVFVLPSAGSPGAPASSPPAPPQAAPVPPAPPSQVSSLPRLGSLLFRSAQAPVEVWVGDRRQGEATPNADLQVANLPVGTYPVKATAKQKGFKPWSREVQVVADARTPVDIDLDPLGPPPVIKGEDGVEMVLIPGGEFWMGSTREEVDRVIEECKRDGFTEQTCKDWLERDLPRHTVRVAPYYLDRTEVTNAQFARFIRASNSAQGNWQERASGKDPHPVVNVTWPDALAYCTWAAKRLPTEAEWEYAARGTDGRKYPWGNTWDTGKANNGSGTTAVGSYPTGASPFGVLDLAGNVWEWTSSLYKPYPYSATDGREDLNAWGLRVYRGGSWPQSPWTLRSSVRFRSDPTFRSIFLGFRCAQGVQ